MTPATSGDGHESTDFGRWALWLRILVGIERVIFAFVGALFFLAALALAIRAAGDLWSLSAGPHAAIITAGTAFLDLMLLVLMMVELAATVIVSLRGTILAAEPFLIVGLIAVIRRILVITVDNVAATGDHNAWMEKSIELAVLTVVTLALVGSIAWLRRRT